MAASTTEDKMAADYSSDDEGLPIGDISQPTAAQIEAEMFDDWVGTFTEPRDETITKMVGDITRVRGEFNRYAAVSPCVAPMMTYFVQDNSKLTAKIKEQAAQLDLVTGVAHHYKCYEEDSNGYMCVICCEFFYEAFICPDGYAIHQNYKAARCGHDIEDFDDDIVCFGCRPFTGWKEKYADGNTMTFCSPQCKQMSQELRKCQDDLLDTVIVQDGAYFGYGDCFLTPDAFQAAKEAHAVLYAYQRRHLTTEPYNDFPVSVVPVWKEYAKHVKILNEPAPAEGEY